MSLGRDELLAAICEFQTSSYKMYDIFVENHALLHDLANEGIICINESSIQIITQ